MDSEFYIQARREWDERYGDLVLGKRNWQIASAGLMLLSLVLALGIVWMSARSKVIPYIVEVDKLGYAFAITIALTPSNTPATVERIGLANPIEAIEFRMEHAGLSWKQVAARQRRILKSILYSLAVVAIGGPLIALARCAGVMRPTFPENNPGAAESLYEPLHPLLYSRDVFLPSWTSTRNITGGPMLVRAATCPSSGARFRCAAPLCAIICGR